MNKNGGNLRRLLTHHSSSYTSCGPTISGVKKREKVKRLSEGRMSSNNDDDEHLHRRTKFKLPKKGFCDAIPVHPASVPRKLRSAISKRSCRSTSVLLKDSKRLKQSINGGVGSLRRDWLKSSKTNMQASEPLTKEEEEVAETLFALAGMISSNGESLKSTTPDCARNDHDDPLSSSKDLVIREEEQGTACNESSSHVNDAIPAADDSKRDSVQAKLMSETSLLNWPKLSERRQLNQDLKVSAPPALRACDEKQATKSATISQISNDTNSHRGVNDTKLQKVSFPLWQSQHFVDSLAVDKVSSHGRSSATVFPSWVNATTTPSILGTCGDNVLMDKVPSSVDGTMKLRKKCMTHVYISRMIQRLEMLEAKDDQPLDAGQLRPSQSSFIAPDKNDLNGAFTTHIFGTTTYKNVCETGDRVVPTNLEPCEGKDDRSTKRNFDLSLATGAAFQSNRLGSCLEANGKVPHLHSVSQANASLPCSTSKNCFSSKVHRDQVAVASLAMPRGPSQMQLQMPQYFSGTFNAAHISHTGTGTGTANLTQIAQHQHQYLQQQQLLQRHQQQQQQQQQNQHPHAHPHHQQQQQQQQQIWTSQLAAQFRPGSHPPSHIANWQNRKQDLRISTHAWPTPSQPSWEITGAKYLHISQHQQQLIERCPPLPLCSTKPQTSQLPTVCENKGGRFQPDGALPFQLLCNKQ